MSVKHLFIIFCLLGAPFAVSVAQTGVYVPEMVSLDTAFKNFMSKWNIPGASISVVQEGRLVYSRGFGFANVENKERTTPTHSFRVASISKSITGILLMKMIEDGLLSIDDLVFGESGILNDPMYQTIKDPRAKLITIRHLLQHTSGFGFINNGNSDPMFMNTAIANYMGAGKPASPELTIQYMLRYENLKSIPGMTYFYSNFGYLILGRVVEKLTGKTYEEYGKSILREYVGISEMRIGKNRFEDRFQNEVTYYDYESAPMAYSIYGNASVVPWPYGGFHLEGMDSHGGWIASSVDLARLMVAVDGFESKPDFLSDQSVNLLSTTSPANWNYAMGFGVSSNGHWWHNGSLPGTTSLWVRTSFGLTWIVLMNTRPHYSQDLNTAIDIFMWDELLKLRSWPSHDLFNLYPVGIPSDDRTLPTGFALLQNYPNPFNPSTTIEYELSEPATVRLTVSDVMGRELAVLVDEHQATGRHTAQFSGHQLSSGVYVYRLDVQGRTIMRKMALIK